MSQLWAWVETLTEPGTITLMPDEARHVVSRRLRVGDALTVFDAKGRIASARVESLVRKAVQVEIGAIEQISPPSSGFRLVTAIPKGERLSTMLQMWTQLGLEVWQPLICHDSAIRKLDIESPRIRRILVEGCKVARRPWAMRVLSPLRLAEAIGSRDAEASLYYADRAGSRGVFGSADAWVFIGPEAGFSEAEFSLLEAARAKAISLGDYNLRIETAGVAAMAVFNVSQGLSEKMSKGLS
jgi:16S rRNA (uracil1498-N3)-methyltransferase